MSAIPLALSNAVRVTARTPPVLLRNFFVEKDASNQVDGLMRLPRPALTLFATLINGGKSRGIFRHDGVFGGDYFAVSGTTLFRVTAAGSATNLGTISGNGQVVFAASPTKILLTAGITCYSTDGASITPITMPAGENVSSVAYIDGYFILTVAQSSIFFWLAPGDTNPDAFNFASVENAAGFVLRCVRFLDEIWFFKKESLEVWQVTGDLDAPFIRIPGRLYGKGAANADTIAYLDNELFSVGNDLLVYRWGAAPVRISDHTVEEYLRLNGQGSLSGLTFAIDGHTFYLLTIGALATLVYDVENQNWTHWSTFGRLTLRANCAAQNGAQIICGDDTNESLWFVDPTKSNDNGVIIERLVYGGVAVVGKAQRCDVVRLFCQTGWAPDINTDPVVELNWFDDQTGLFDGPWMAASAGRQGEYNIIVEWRQLGAMYAPGRIFVFRFTDDAPSRVSYARMNEDD